MKITVNLATPPTFRERYGLVLGVPVLVFGVLLAALLGHYVRKNYREKVELAQLLAQSDFVSISCPLAKDSRKLFGAAQFAAMQPHAIFITTARGFIHDETALAVEKVRYVGDNVACVVAISESIAEQALELIDVEYELLPAYFDPEDAMKATSDSDSI